MTASSGPGALPVRLDATVTGRVQGVGYRYFVLEAATRLGLGGWVANEPGGSVRCVAEGPQTALQELLLALERGSFGARVEGVRTTWGPAAGTFTRFDIRSGAHTGD